MNLIYIAATIVAAMLCGFGFVLQQHAAEQVRSAEFLKLGLIARLVHNRRWLGGIAALVAGDLLSAWTLGHLDLSVSEPLLTTSLIFALVLAVPLTGQALRRAEIIGAVLLTAGVGALSATRSVRSPTESFGSFSHWPAAALIALIAAALVWVGRRRRGNVRATLTGTAAGLVFGIADAFTRRSVQLLDGHHPVSLLTTWPGYATVLTSIVGLWLMQNAFSAAPLHASLPAVTAAEPAAGIILGVLVFGDVIHVTPLLLALQAAGIAAMVAGVILVARGRVLRSLHLPQLPPLPQLPQLPQVTLARLQHPTLPRAALAHPSLSHPALPHPAGQVARPAPAGQPGSRPADDTDPAGLDPAATPSPP